MSSTPYKTLEKPQRGCAMTIPSKSQGTAACPRWNISSEQLSRGVMVMARSGRGWRDGAAGSCPGLVPAGPVWGGIYSFSSEFAQSFPVANARDIPLLLNLGAGQGSQEEHHQQSQLGSQIYPKSMFFCLPCVLDFARHPSL